MMNLNANVNSARALGLVDGGGVIVNGYRTWAGDEDLEVESGMCFTHTVKHQHPTNHSERVIMNIPHSLTSAELQARTDAALELARVVAGLNPFAISFDRTRVEIGCGKFGHVQTLARRALGSTPELDAEFSRFLNWARSEGKDSAHTFDTDRNQWIALNPATADLWRAWRVAAGVSVPPSSVPDKS